MPKNETFSAAALLHTNKFQLGSRLPDGFVSDQKSQFGYIWEDLGMENVVINPGHLEYITTIGYIFCGHLVIFCNFVYFSPLWYIVPRKIWQPWLGCISAKPILQISVE
jgi:hypothetical protein